MTCDKDDGFILYHVTINQVCALIPQHVPKQMLDSGAFVTK